MGIGCKNSKNNEAYFQKPLADAPNEASAWAFLVVDSNLYTAH